MYNMIVKFNFLIIQSRVCTVLCQFILTIMAEPNIFYMSIGQCHPIIGWEIGSAAAHMHPAILNTSCFIFIVFILYKFRGNMPYIRRMRQLFFTGTEKIAHTWYRSAGNFTTLLIVRIN